MASPEFLFTRNPNLEDSWPFVHQRMVRRLGELGPTQVLDTDAQTHVHQQVDLSATIGISHLGRNLTDACIDHAPKLRMVGALTDNSGHGIPYTALQDRGIPVIDSTRAWSQSVAECAFGLALSALRRTAQWHMKMASGEVLWDWRNPIWGRDKLPVAGQFCDDPGFVNGDLGTKRTGVVGLGQIGGTSWRERSTFTTWNRSPWTTNCATGTTWSTPPTSPAGPKTPTSGWRT